MLPALSNQTNVLERFRQGERTVQLWETLIRTYLNDYKNHTVRGYQRDWLDFALFLGCKDVAQLMTTLVAQDGATANLWAQEWKGDMLKVRKLSASTINRRLSALRTLIRLFRRIDAVAWFIEIRGVRNSPYKDIQGVPIVKLREALRLMEEREDPKGKRDVAILRLFHDLALRVSEVAGLDWPEDIDCENGRVRILGKGQWETEWRDIPERTQQSIAEWLMWRGTAPGPLFQNMSRNPDQAGTRLTSRSIARNVLQSVGLKIDTWINPHKLRHTSINEASKVVDVTEGMGPADLREFARHGDIRVTMIYLDRRKEQAANLSRQVSQSL